MNTPLNDSEARVLGSLVEKEITTPEYYPLSLNALVNACNQKNNRDPVMELHEDAVRSALHALNQQGLARTASSADSRVPKYEHQLQEAFNLTRRETAVLCVLLLRGPQTPGELRTRGERMHPFAGLDEVQSALQKLMDREPPLARILPRQPGTKESRYAHMLSGDQPGWNGALSGGSEEVGAVIHRIEAERAMNPSDAERLARLEQDVASLRVLVEQIQRKMDELLAPSNR